jgi:glutamine amidotransferase
MIALLDYGLGNLAAIANVYKTNHIEVGFAHNPDDVDKAERIIIPGVGSFDAAISMLNASGMRPSLENAVLERKIPVLGICVGMQMLANQSDEGNLPGFGWIPGVVRKFSQSLSNKQPRILPHMGWNDVTPTRKNPLFANLENDARFYFVHSYFFECSQKKSELAITDYDGSFASAVHRDNIYGVQFHPEKSHHFGNQLLLNFAKVTSC